MSVVWVAAHLDPRSVADVGPSFYNHTSSSCLICVLCLFVWMVGLLWFRPMIKGKYFKIFNYFLLQILFYNFVLQFGARAGPRQQLIRAVTREQQPKEHALQDRG